MSAFHVRDKVVLLRLNRLDYVPSGLYAAQILAEQGLPVLALEYGFFQKTWERELSKVPRLRIGHPWLRRLPGPLRALGLHALATLRVGWLVLRQGRPRLMIAHGLQEQLVARLLSVFLRFPYAVHVHEVYETASARGWNRCFLALEGWALRGARFTIFPESRRAEVYRERYELRAPSFLAFNCPRLLPAPTPTDWRARLGLPAQSQLLGYWGGQGRTNALDQGIRAVARLPRVYFLLWGWSSTEDRRQFKQLAEGVGAADRVLFLGEMPECKWSALAGLDAAYCLYEPRELRLRHLATASNKLMEALACGVPVLSSNNPDFEEVVEGHRVGLCAPDFTVGSIAQTLARLLNERSDHAVYARNARTVHEKRFHYEMQFAPILREICALPSQAPVPSLAPSPT